MNITSISKKDREVKISLTADELILLCNMMHEQRKEKHNDEKLLQLYSEMIIARDLCQYGSLDNFALQNIVKCRNHINDGLDGILPDEDIDTFNAYLEQNDMKTAFGNSDWNKIYSKIVGQHGKRRSSPQLKQWMNENLLS